METTASSARVNTDDPLYRAKGAVRVWARWARERAIRGYPPHSWEGRAILRGGSAPRPEDMTRPLPGNTVAEAVEVEVNLLDRRLRACILQRHIYSRGDRDACKQVSLSMSGFREMCTRAYWCVHRGLNY